MCQIYLVNKQKNFIAKKVHFPTTKNKYSFLPKPTCGFDLLRS